MEHHQELKLKTQQKNEHYYSSVPDELDDDDPKGKLSFTIKMKPVVPNKNNQNNISSKITNQRRPSKNSLQSDLSDLNRLTRRSRDIAHSTEDILTSTSTSGFSQFKAIKDFGDFQIYTTPVKKYPKMVDV